MILATWLCEAAKEEQTSCLLVTLKVLSYVSFIFCMIFCYYGMALKANLKFSVA